MSFVTKLIIDNKEIEILSYRFGFSKPIDLSNKPVQVASFKGLEIEIESDGSNFFEQWAISNKKKTQIELQIFYPYLNGGSRKMIFYDCYLVGYENTFSNNNEEPVKEKLLITTAGIKLPYSQVEYETDWRKTFDQQEGKGKLRESDLIINSAYFEDEEGNIITEKYIGTVFLVIETENNVGKKVSFDLTDKEHDFKYKGKRLEDDFLKDVTITGNITKVELEIIEE